MKWKGDEVEGGGGSDTILVLALALMLIIFIPNTPLFLISQMHFNLNLNDKRMKRIAIILT